MKKPEQTGDCAGVRPPSGDLNPLELLHCHDLDPAADDEPADVETLSPRFVPVSVAGSNGLIRGRQSVTATRRQTLVIRPEPCWKAARGKAAHGKVELTELADDLDRATCACPPCPVHDARRELRMVRSTSAASWQ